jgi:site-specific DNA-methyltransferase (adenine-specific)
MVRLFHGDCMTAMKEMPDKAYELAIVDSPYGLQAQGGVNRYAGGGLHTKSIVKFGSRFSMADSYNGKRWDESVPTDEYFKELFRLSRNQIIWGGNYFGLPPCRCFVTWDKIRVVENFSQVEFAWTSFNSPPLLFRFCGNGGFILAPEDAKIHPTQKPVKLYKWLLKNYAKPGDKILDTHLGSGSSAIACDIMGYSMDGYEIDADYFQAASERLERHQRQGVLEI